MAEHHDYVALEWVKGEIEETLKQAEQALEAYVASPEDATRMRFCLTYIHQVHGTLQMVEFYGAALLAEEMEKVAQAILNDKVSHVKEAQEVLMQAILQLPGYLEHLQAGKEDMPVTLLPLLNDLRSACGESLLTETSLFSPNLLPLRSEGEFKFSSVNASEKLTKLREAYKLGLLGIIRHAGLDKSYATLAKVCMHLEQLCGEAPIARLWWIAGAVIDGMASNTVESGISVITLLRQLEKEISRLANLGDEGLNQPVPEELAKNLLYYIAKSSSESPSIRSIKQVFGLTAALPEEQEASQALQGSSYKSAMGSVVSALSEELANLKEQFDLYTRSSDYSLDKLAELGASFKQIADTLAVLGMGPQRKSLLDQHDKLTHWVETNSRPEQSELMSIASELLMVEVGLNSATQTKSKSEAVSDIPVDALNTAQSAVVKECRNGLEQVKDSIIGYIASQWQPSEISNVPDVLRSVEGALSMLPQLSKAAEILKEARHVIQHRLLSDAAIDPTWEMMDSLADAVAGVDYFLERVTENAQEDGTSVLAVAAESISEITGRSLPELNSEDDLDVSLNATDLDESYEEETDLIPQLDEGLSDALESDLSFDINMDASVESNELELELDESFEMDLEDSSLDETISLDDQVAESLASVIDEETDLIMEANIELPEDSEAELVLEPENTEDLDLASDDDLSEFLEQTEALEPAAEVDTDIGALDSVVTDTVLEPEPVAESFDSDDMIDDEIIEIFIEEAEEVQETIAEFLPVYKGDSSNTDAQTEVRRAFHTLKGSGRMVGAEQVGELAWKIENMLNRVIDNTIQASPDMFRLIDDVCAILPQLVAAFAKGQRSELDTDALMDAADALVAGQAYSPSVSTSEESVSATPELESQEDELLESDTVVDIDLQDSLELDEQAQSISSTDEEMSDLLEIFQSEAETHLDVLDTYLIANKDLPSCSLTDDVQRALHTLKGSAHMAEVTFVAELAGDCEHTVKEARSAHLQADSLLIEQLLEAADWIRDAVAHLGKEGYEPPFIPVDWRERLAASLDRLPTEVLPGEDSSSIEESDEASADNQMMHIFLMEGMDILGDIELNTQQWVSEPSSIAHAESLEAEFITLARAAKMARVNAFHELSQAIAELIQRVVAIQGTPNSNFFALLDQGYESLVSLMDLLAAGQAIPSTHDFINELTSKDVEQLVDTDTLIESVEHIAQDEASNVDVLSLTEPEIDLSTDALETTENSSDIDVNTSSDKAMEELTDVLSQELNLDDVDLPDFDLASDDDLAALVDEFDEFGDESLVSEEVDSTEHSQLVEPDMSEFSTEDTVDDAISEAHEEVDSELVDIFLDEADDIVSHLDENLDQWRKSPEQLEIITELQRAIHTLKGGARLSEIKAIGDLCHELENLYEGLSERRFTYSEPLADLLQDCHDAIATQVADIHENKLPSSYPELEQKIIDAMAGKVDEPAIPTLENEALEALSTEATEDLSSAIAQPLSSNVDPELVEIFLEEAEEILESITEQLEKWAGAQDDLSPVAELQRELHTLKGGARMAELSPIGDLGHELENLYEGLVEGTFNSSESLLDLLRSCHDRLADMIDSVIRGHMPLAAADLIQAITSYCESGSYDDSILVSQIPVLSEETAIESSIEESEEQPSQELPESSTISDLEEVEALGEDSLPTESQPEFESDETVEFDFELTDSLEALSEPLEVNKEETEEALDLDILGLSALDAAALEVSDIFIEEAVDLSEQLDNACHGWRQDPQSGAHRNDVLRVLHTLKGGAKLAKLDALADVCHEFETHLEQFTGDIDEQFFVDLISRTDQLQQLIEELSLPEADQTIQSSSISEADLEEALPGLSDLGLESLDSALVESESATLESFELSDEMLLDEISHLDDAVEAPDELELGNKVEVEKLPAPEFGPVIRENILDQSSKGGQEAVKVSSDLLENLVNLAGETSISRGRLETEITDIGFTLEDMDMTVSRLRDQLKRLDIETQAQISYRTEMQQTQDYDDFDPLEMDRYTNMQQLSRSLLESVTDILDLRSTLENKVRDSETLLLQQSRINTELQEGLMRTRMVPFSRLVPRLRRIVRQISQELGKQVDFKVHNAEGEMDRTVLERMVAPLEHMLRNAVDHGIEMPEDRKKAGKRVKGTIELFVGREGGDVVLDLKDDGAGVNIEAVRNKAIERNLMKPDSDLTEHEIMQFIFNPGFSTASKVTQISGRGVGMDVVNSEIKQLGGNVALDSQYGKGSRFEVRLPFTVSVNRALMVRVGDDLYAVPLNTIEGIVRVSPYELEEFYSEGNETPYIYAGKEYRMEYMGDLLKSGHKPKLQGQVLPLPVILVKGAEHPIALQVDSLMGSREVVVKSIGSQFSTVDGVSGATILGDGSVVIILDLAALIRADYAQSLERRKEESTLLPDKIENTDRPLKVMVVDDSVTVRKVTTRVLQRQGYEVFTAKDGVDAIAKLQDEQPDIMLLDIEMPRMDGFEVASHVRHNPQISGLPIIMITSRTGEKHRERAMSIGVNHYMGKPFQESVLLETIELLVGK